MAESLLSFRGVSHRFGALPVLQMVSLEVPRGGLHCLLGPSGCGKTTILRLAGGLLRPSEGEVLLAGRPALEAWERAAYVFQEPRLIPWRTAQGNVELALELRHPRLNPRERRARIEQTLARVELSEEAGRYPSELSGGQAQRVALARALVTTPDVLLMDEPFGALDPGTRQRLRRTLLEILERSGTTVVFVTHDVEEALQLGQQVLVLSSRPARVLEAHELPQPHPRDPARDPELRALAQAILARFPTGPAAAAALGARA